MNLLNKKHLQELKLLKHFLMTKNNEYQNFKRIYESSNNKKVKDEKEIVILTDNGNHIFSNISEDVIEYFVEKGFFSDEVYNPKTRTIKINNILDLYKTIEILIDILEFYLISKDVDLSKFDVS